MQDLHQALKTEIVEKGSAEGVNFVVEKSPDGMLVRPERRPQIPGFLAEAVSHAYARYTPEEME